MAGSSLDSGILTTDANLMIGSWDDWLALVTGISATAARGQSLAELFPDIPRRGLLARFEHVLEEGVVEVLSPALHHYLLECPLTTPSKYFDKMQQRVTIAPLRENNGIVGTIVTIEDVTARLERERDLADQLASDDEGVRLEAAAAMAELEELVSVQSLADILSDESWRVRKLAVDGLARHGGQDSVGWLVRALREEHRNPSVLNSALQVLALGGMDAVGPLAECLIDPDSDLRIYAAHALGDQQDARAIPPLVQALDDPDANVRYHAIEALGKLRAADAVDRLLGIVESGDFYLAFPALDALATIADSRIAPRLVPLLSDEMLRVPAAQALGQLGDEEMVSPLVALLNRPGAPAGMICVALADLYDRHQRTYGEGSYIAGLAGRFAGPAAAQNLLDALNVASDDVLRALVLVLGWMEGEAIDRALTKLLGSARVRKEVIEALVRHGTRVTELLVEQLDSEDREVGQAAAMALGRIGDARAVPGLVRVLSGDHESIAVAAGALARIGDCRAFDALLDFVGHPRAAVRQAVVAAINSVGHPDTAQRVAALLDHPDPNVRESAVKIAGYFGYPCCRELLVERCNDEDETVRRAAIDHIVYLEDDRALSVLAGVLDRGTPRARASAAQALGQVEDPRAASHLLAALNDHDRWVRYFAARSISRRPFPESLDTLAKLAQSDPANQVRIAAIESLARVGGARATAILATLAESSDTDVAGAALAGLGLVGHPDALAPLVAALRSADPARRIHALRALGERGGDDALEPVKWAAAAESQPNVLESAIDALVRMSTLGAINALIVLASDPARHDACVSALAQLGKDHIDVIGEAWSEAQPGARRAIVRALERIKQPRASELLTAALDDPDQSVRLQAVNALAHLGNRSRERKLVLMARTDSDPNVRRAAQKVLRQ